MKWVFIFGLMIGTPLLAAMLRSNRRLIVPACFLLGPALYLLGPTLWAAPVSWPYWPGVARGIYVSFIDGVAIALIAATSPARIPLTVKLTFAVYCLGLIISAFVAQVGLWPVAFYGWQVFRTALLFVAICRVAASVKEAPVALIAGLSVGVMIESVVVAYQFAKGVPRAGGTFNNSNYMGLSLDYVIFPAVALMLGTRRILWPGLTIMAAVVIAVCGGSRATLGLVAAGLLLTVFLSVVHNKSSRKFSFAGLVVLVLVLSAPLMIWGANQRSQEVLISSDQMRSSMKLAAKMIIADYPFGIGANEYVVIANSSGYNARAGVPWNEENRVVPVHNTYYLVAAEMGLIGLVGLVGILAAFILLGMRMLGQRWDDESNELVPGLLATMIVVAVHISFEFVAMDFLLHSMFAIAAGLLVGLHARKRAAQRSVAASWPGPQALASAT